VKPAVALGASLACAVLAVSLVGFDLAFNVEARLEARDAAGAWQTVSGNPRPFLDRPSGCSGPELRLVVHNGLPWSTSITFAVDGYAADGRSLQIVPTTTWNLGGGEERALEFTVPASAFNATREKPPAQVNVVFDREIYLGTCVQESPP
jgi:hypothetical protein